MLSTFRDTSSRFFEKNVASQRTATIPVLARSWHWPALGTDSVRKQARAGLFQLKGRDHMSLYKMGANQDRVAKMRKEMEHAIESAFSASWLDEYYTQIYGKPLIEKLLDDLERIAASYAKDLA